MCAWSIAGQTQILKSGQERHGFLFLLSSLLVYQDKCNTLKIHVLRTKKLRILYIESSNTVFPLGFILSNYFAPDLECQISLSCEEFL